MRVVIMADGEGRRWQDSQGARRFLAVVSGAARIALSSRPSHTLNRLAYHLRKAFSKRRLPPCKQLLQVDGETLLARQVRLLRANGITEIYIASRSKRCEVEGAVRYTPIDNIYEIDRFSSSAALWNTEGETLYIYGDVFYTELSMAIICNSATQDWNWFGRVDPSFVPGHRDPELFAFRFHCNSHEIIKQAIDTVRCQYIEGRRLKCIGWDLLRCLHGLPPDSSETPMDNLTEIQDLTSDFDTLDEYNEWIKIYNQAQPADFVRRLGQVLERNNIPRTGIIHVGTCVFQEIGPYLGFEATLLINPDPAYRTYLSFLEEQVPGIKTFNFGVGPDHPRIETPTTDYWQVKPADTAELLINGEELPVEVRPLRWFQDKHNVLVIEVPGFELDVLSGADLSFFDVVICSSLDSSRESDITPGERLQDLMGRAGFVRVEECSDHTRKVSHALFVKSSFSPRSNSPQ